MWIWQKRQYKTEIKEILGEGLTSCVYRAIRKHIQLGVEQEVALKVFKSDEQVQALKNEMEILTKVQSPHCVRMLGWDELRGRTAIVLEYLRGVSLFELYLYSQPSRALVTEIVGQIQEGLKHLHQNKLFHGDLNPKNIFITDQGEVKLLDFGFAGKEGVLLTACTPDYLAPEGWLEGKLSPASDLFSLGLIELDLKRGVFPQGKEVIGSRERVESSFDQNVYLKKNPKDRNYQNILLDNKLQKELANLVQVVIGKKQTAHLGTKIMTQIQFFKEKSLWWISYFRYLTMLLVFVFSQALQPAIEPEKFSLDLRSPYWSRIQVYQLSGEEKLLILQKYTPAKIRHLPSGKYMVRWQTREQNGIIFVQLSKNRRILIP